MSALLRTLVVLPGAVARRPGDRHRPSADGELNGAGIGDSGAHELRAPARLDDCAAVRGRTPRRGRRVGHRPEDGAMAGITGGSGE